MFLCVQVKTGTMLNIICITVVTVAINTFGYAYFNLDRFPEWAARLVEATPTAIANTTSIVLNETSVTVDSVSSLLEMFTYNVTSA